MTTPIDEAAREELAQDISHATIVGSETGEFKQFKNSMEFSRYIAGHILAAGYRKTMTDSAAAIVVTHEMRGAGEQAFWAMCGNWHIFDDVYRAMLAAAPATDSPPADALFESVTPAGLRARAEIVARYGLGDNGSCVRHLELAAQELERLAAKVSRLRADGVNAVAAMKIADEIIEIMAEYDRQFDRGSVDSPGGFEHLGDVWKQMREWANAAIRAREQAPPVT